MKIAVIADDLTGANDTGVQFARNGLNTSVLFEFIQGTSVMPDAVVIDTDSRSSSDREAYARVEEAGQYVKEMGFDLVYKKVDSTLRGNIGVELDAVYDTLRPDFIIFAPAYPQNNRKVINGNLFLGEKLLHETEFANDPRTPITDSYIPELIEKSSKYKTGLIKQADLEDGIERKLADYAKDKIPYIVFDSSSEQDLQTIVNHINVSNYQVIWSGSAGLATQLFPQLNNRKPAAEKEELTGKALFVIGSVNPINQKQIDALLNEADIEAITIYPNRFLANDLSSHQETIRIIKEAGKVLEKNKHVALILSCDNEEIKKAHYYGNLLGKNLTTVSENIAEQTGVITAELVTHFNLQKLFLTGGDIAKKTCNALGATRFDLIEEIEIGLPLGVLVCKDDRKIRTVTKAGGFGSEHAMVRALEEL